MFSLALIFGVDVTLSLGRLTFNLETGIVLESTANENGRNKSKY